MGPKRKGGGDRSPTGRKGSAADKGEGDDNTTMQMQTAGAGATGSPPNSDRNEPQVEGYLELEADLNPSVDVNNQQEFFVEPSNEVSTEFHPGEVDVKVEEHLEGELLLQFEDEDGLDNNTNKELEINSSGDKAGEDLYAAPSTSKSSKWKVSTTECETFAEDIGDGDLQVLQHPEDELGLQFEDEGGLESYTTNDSVMASRDPTDGDDLQTTASTSKSSENEGNLSTTECETLAAAERGAINDNEANSNDSPDVDVPLLNKKILKVHVATASNVVADEGKVQGNKEKAGTSLRSESPLSSPIAREIALQNPVILHHLFQVCPASIVASCRLVCKPWYNESLVTWRTAFPMKFAQISPLKDFLEFNDNPENQCVSRPYRNFSIYGYQNFPAEDFKLFWKAIGSNITTLNLSDCSFSSTEEFRQVIFKCCPVLQKLHIQNCYFPAQISSGRDEHHKLEYIEPVYGEHKHLKSLCMMMEHSEWNEAEVYFPISWLELFSHYPLLNSCDIYVFGMGEFPGAEFETLIKAIRMIRKNDARKLLFRRFKLYPKLVISRESKSHHKFSLVKELHLPLTDCSIKMHPELEQRFLTNTLSYLAPSLNKIFLGAEYDEKAGQRTVTPTWFRDFPFGIHLDNLTRLESFCDFWENFTFLKYAPNLSSLVVFNYETPQEMSTSVTMAVSNTCQEELANVELLRLTTFAFGFLVTDSEILQLFKWMPNITNLRMVLDDKLFALACQNWKNLKNVTVLGDVLTAKGVTAIEKADKAYQFGVRPNIANLERLESLVLGIELPPESVFHLFLYLPCLQTLQDGYGIAQRGDVDISSYQRAVQDNVVEQWIADKGRVLQESEEEEDDEDDDEGEEDEEEEVA